MWGETAYRVWLPTKDAVVRARSQDLAQLDSIQPTVEHILHTAAAAKLLDALEEPWRGQFLEDYRRRMARCYPRRADGVTLFPFRRLFIVARREG